MRGWPGSSISRLSRRMPTRPRRACLTSLQRPRVRPHRGDGRACLAQTKRRCALRGRPAGDGAEANLRDGRGARGRPLQPKVEGTAWKSKPSWYVLCREDQTVHPELQRSVSKRMKATTTEVTASHVSMLSKPDVVLDVIRKAASAELAEPCQGRAPARWFPLVVAQMRSANAYHRVGGLR